MHQPQTTLDNACQPLSPHIAQAIAPYNPAQPQYWNALWRSTLEASRASGRGCECWQNWNELAEARNYWKRVSERTSTTAALPMCWQKCKATGACLILARGLAPWRCLWRAK